MTDKSVSSSAIASDNFEQSLDNIRNGRVYEYDSVDDFFKDVLEK